MVDQLIPRLQRGNRLANDDVLNLTSEGVMLAQYLKDPLTTDTPIDQNYTGRTIIVNSAGNVNLTLINIKKGFQANVLQLGIGTVTILAGSTLLGTTILLSLSAYTKTAGQYAILGLLSPSNNNVIIFGQGA